jgi:very-short-patch-repair endonuclease
MSDHFRSHWERRLGRCESPIESMLLEQFCAAAVEWGYDVGRAVKVQSETIVVKPQAHVDRWRVDFLITFDFFGSLIEIIVECDGHQWHERTKSQATKDRSRDRALQSLGYEVLRFTGSEINAAPARCAFEVLDRIMEFQTACFVHAVETAERKDAR